jgi:hypothetical protein
MISCTRVDRFSALSLGLHERKSMPLLAYFVTVGSSLTALLLLFNFILEPPKPETSMQAATAVETSLRKPRTTIGSGFRESTISMVPNAPASEARPESEIGGNLAQVAHQPSSRDKAARRSFRTTNYKSSRKITSAARAYRAPAYSSYSRQPQKRQFSTAEGTLGPH